MYATPIVAAILIDSVSMWNDGEHTLMTRVAPNDYDAFAALPAAVSFEGHNYGRTGWNSDTGACYYSTGRAFATAV